MISAREADGARAEIILVGAGPGDPELITLAGARALAGADVVIYDRLVHPALLDHAPDAEHIYIGKEPGENHHLTQQRIHAVMLEHARAGRRVVRLKGGDPFIFGRGGEELAAAREAGLAVRVIPGITAALGAASAGDIALTHRDLSSSVAFLTGCSATGQLRGDVDIGALARAVETLVIYMGAARLKEIAAQLLAAGRPADDPVAVVRRATWDDQEIMITTLADLADDGDGGLRVAPPAIAIIGPVVRLREKLAALAADAMRGGS